MSVLNPFSPTSEEEKKYLELLCGKSHCRFIEHVRKYRGSKLAAD